jgi:hypothetical protein
MQAIDLEIGLNLPRQPINKPISLIWDDSLATSALIWLQAFLCNLSISLLKENNLVFLRKQVIS